MLTQKWWTLISGLDADVLGCVELADAILPV